MSNREPMALKIIQNVKSALFAGFLAEQDQTLEQTALELRAALNQVALPLAAVDVETFVNRLQARCNGDRIEARCAQEGLDRPELASTPRFVEAFGTTTFRFRQTVVGIDVFNAGGEFGVAPSQRDVAIELFRVDGWDASQFVDLVGLLFGRTKVRFVFGGISFFAEEFAHLRLAGMVEGVDDLLWPLTAYVPPRPPTTKVFRSLVNDRGVVLQVFEDLWTGNEDRYRAAAQEAGLHSFWELRKSLNGMSHRRGKRRPSDGIAK